MLAIVYEPEEGSTTFEELVREHRARIYGICYRYAGNPADADDLAQDVLLKVYRGLPTFRGDARLSTWIYRIAVNTCLNWIWGRRAKEERTSCRMTSSTRASRRPSVFLSGKSKRSCRRRFGSSRIDSG